MSDSVNKLKELCNWELKEGSHDWPGPDGGTCINEAAIVVAGLDYREVLDSSSLPPCFSKPLGVFLINLNDQMNDEDRQKLIKYVTKLPGSADTDEIEKQRMLLINSRMLELAELTEIDSLQNSYYRSMFSPKMYSSSDDYEEMLKQFEVCICIWCFEFADADDLIAIVDEAFAIGKQADPIDISTVLERVSEAKKKAALGVE